VLGVEASTSLKPSWRLCTGAPVEAESAPSAIAFQAIEAFSPSTSAAGENPEISIQVENLAGGHYRRLRILDHPAGCGFKVIREEPAIGRPLPQEELRYVMMAAMLRSTALGGQICSAS
jgi:hypothetical protein